ncbi:MAG: ASPIC/UnbV domain-containing protein, partial [Planctomycetes bacterium]|nr:ASPIC/UnbV domain-containing protein [Planctomycetota bacterium]
TMVDELTIHWPDGVTETHRNLAVDRVISLTHTPTYPGNGSRFGIGSLPPEPGAETQLEKDS